MSTIGALDTVVPTEHESQLAEENSRALSSYVRETEEQTIRVIPEGVRTRGSDNNPCGSISPTCHHSDANGAG